MHALLLPLLLLFLSVGASFDGPKEAAVWLDDGNGHTVKELLSPQESLEFSETLRETMGLPDHKKFKLRHNNLDASAPRFMKSIYNTLDELGMPRDDRMDPAQRDVLERADTVVTFTSKAPPVRMIAAPPHHAASRLLYFNTSEVSLDHTLLAAELRVHYSPRNHQYQDLRQRQSQEGPLVLHIYLVTNENGGELKMGEILLEREGWVELNVTASCLAWLLIPRENRGVRLAVTTQGKAHEHKLHSVGISTAHDREDLRPILVAFFTHPTDGLAVTSSQLPSAFSYTPDATLLSRSTRSIPIDSGTAESTTSSSSNCQMRPLYVSFSDLDWQKWVIAPNGYDANFCDGSCEFPMPAEVNATNHAIVQTLVKILGAHQGDKDVPSASCAPKDLLTISVLYYDYNNNVVLKKYPKMVVKNCACR